MKVSTIKIIYDNCKAVEDLQEGWGFSALVETGKRKILFDTGNDRDAFFSNSEKMGIRCNEITDVVFSHKHDDHVAGCEEILGSLRKDCRVFVPKGFPRKKIPSYLPIHTVADFGEIDTDVFSMVLKGGMFLYEQILILQTKKGLVILTGCAHPGIVKILKAAQSKFQKPIHLVLGGFHLFRKSNTFIDDIVAEFQSLKVEKAAPCHCSGAHAIQSLEQAYGDRFYKVGTGTVVTV